MVRDGFLIMAMIKVPPGAKHMTAIPLYLALIVAFFSYLLLMCATDLAESISGMISAAIGVAAFLIGGLYVTSVFEVDDSLVPSIGEAIRKTNKASKGMCKNSRVRHVDE